MNVQNDTFKRYASLYYDEDGNTLYSKFINKGGKGVKHRVKYTSGTHEISLKNITTGRTKNHFKRHKLAELIVRENLIEECCGNCLFSERRITDYSMPLLLDFIDGDPKNGKLENIRFLCYNCYYLIVGAVQLSRITAFTTHADNLESQ